jgi:hypothetical protein
MDRIPLKQTKEEKGGRRPRGETNRKNKIEIEEGL